MNEYRDVNVKISKKIDRLGIDYQEAIAALLYHNGSLSLREARLMVGKSRREFEEDILPKFGFTTMGETQDEWETELNA
jgi:hypothetical protein